MVEGTATEVHAKFSLKLYLSFLTNKKVFNTFSNFESNPYIVKSLIPR